MRDGCYRCAPRQQIQARFRPVCGDRGPRHRQGVHWHRHVRTQFGDGGIRAATLVDKHVDALGDRMAEEPLALAINLGARDPCRIVAATRKLEHPSQVVQFLGRLGLVIAVELHVDTDLGLFVERRQRGNAVDCSRWRRRISRAPASKYSMAAAWDRTGRMESVKDTALSSLLKKQLTPQTTAGAACRAISSSVITPSVPQAPIKRSMASISSATK